jgi:hypothetical protein
MEQKHHVKCKEKTELHCLRESWPRAYLLFLRLNRLSSPGRGTAEGIENGNLDGGLFSILIAHESERHLDSAVL